jgi:predicted DNA-binding transcriptional regulator AlpA
MVASRCHSRRCLGTGECQPARGKVQRGNDLAEQEQARLASAEGVRTTRRAGTDDRSLFGSNLEKLVLFDELKDRFGVPFTRRHLLNLENDKKFPARVPIGDNRVGRVESEVEEWVKEKIKARSQ